MHFHNIKDIKDFKNKTVLVRADFNVPIKNGRILDDFKIKKGTATIKYLLNKKAKVVLVSHLGRPSGYDKKLSLKPVKNLLEKFLRKKIKFLDVKDWKKVQGDIVKLPSGDVTLLENIRFIKGEEENDKRVAKRLAGLADIFVLDGFAVSHRAAASVSGVAKYLPAYAGLLLTQELDGLAKVLTQPKHPLVVVLGGAKMETKIPVLKNLLSKADHILLGGGIVNTYLWAKGYKIGSSLIEKNFKREAKKYCSKHKVVMPVDVIVGNAKGKQARAIKIDKKFKVKNGQGIYDIGPETIKLFSKYIKSAQTLVWNGAVGYFEQHPYEYGTYSVARLMAARAKGKAFGVCGGGETVEVLRKLGLMSGIDLVSTGGGAMLEYLSGEKLPGVEVVKHKLHFLHKIFN
ncbi:MAG: phosphoglycerate kinase [Patescibacteria group bacterium]